jgi:hypothetical protein
MDVKFVDFEGCYTLGVVLLLKAEYPGEEEDHMRPF